MTFLFVVWNSYVFLITDYLSAFCKRLELLLCSKCCNLDNFLADVSVGFCLVGLVFLCVCAESWEFVWFWRKAASKSVVCWIYNHISSCHKAILSGVVWRNRKADDVHLIKHSLLGWRQDCETWTGSLNVFWESRNNLSVNLSPITVNHFGMFSNSSRKQINGK